MNVISRIAESVTTRVGVKVVYGEPVTLGGVELVPVAVVQFGFGGGSDTAGENGEEGAGGGGGGGMTIPVGAYVSRPNGPRFEPNPLALLAVLIPLVAVTGGAAAKLVKALKK